MGWEHGAPFGVSETWLIGTKADDSPFPPGTKGKCQRGWGTRGIVGVKLSLLLLYESWHWGPKLRRSLKPSSCDVYVGEGGSVFSGLLSLLVAFFHGDSMCGAWVIRVICLCVVHYLAWKTETHTYSNVEEKK